MAAFDLCMTHPLPAMSGWHGGPGQGGHGSHPDWYIEFGMDIGAPVGSAVRAAFTGKVSVFHRDPADTGKGVFGSQIFVRNSEAPADRMGAFYTHLKDVPKRIDNGATITRGEFIGNVMAFTPPHLHMALVEIVGGLPGGKYVGVSSLNDLFKGSVFTDKAVTFFQRAGSQPAAGGTCAAPSATSEGEDRYRYIEQEELASAGEWDGGDGGESYGYESEGYETRWLSTMRINALQRAIGNRALGAALRSPKLPQALAALERAPARYESRSAPSPLPPAGRSKPT